MYGFFCTVMVGYSLLLYHLRRPARARATSRQQ
jgi:hypothetical protein